MDKFEYKVRAEEIKELISLGKYEQAAEIADTIDWRRVKSVMMLCTISDLYKMNKRFEDARDLLLLAYDRRPGGRTIVYSLCELSLKTEEYVQAVEYYKEFVQIAPNDSGRYILQYKIYEAQDVSLEERIAVLEELKRVDYREKWAYELAYLYHRVGMESRCVDECDEIVLWFGEGKYVIKAMELKMLHQDLTPLQQEKYDHRFEEGYVTSYNSSDVLPQQGTMPVSSDTKVFSPEDLGALPDVGTPAKNPNDTQELDIIIKTIDVGEYNTMNLQAEIAAGLREVLAQDTASMADVMQAAREMENSATSTDFYEGSETGDVSLEGISLDDTQDGLIPEDLEGTEVFFGETAEIAHIDEEGGMQELYEDQQYEEQENNQEQNGYDNEYENQQYNQEQYEEAYRNNYNYENVEPPKNIAGVLSQEADGQISLVVPESEKVEKQITGQMSIEDILAEWERMKKENQERRQEQIRRRVLEHTGEMFSEFEASVRDGLLEKLEKGESVRGAARVGGVVAGGAVAGAALGVGVATTALDGDMADLQGSVLSSDDVVEELEEIHDPSDMADMGVESDVPDQEEEFASDEYGVDQEEVFEEGLEGETYNENEDEISQENIQEDVLQEENVEEEGAIQEFQDDENENQNEEVYEENLEDTENPEDEQYYQDGQEYVEGAEDGEYYEAEGEYYEEGEYVEGEDGEYYGEDGEYYGEDGEYYEEDGEYVEGEDGEYYEEDGEYVEGEDGEYYEEDGEYVEGEDGEYYEAEGEYVEGEDGEYYEAEGEYVEGEDGEYYEAEGEYVEGEDGENYENDQEYVEESQEDEESEVISEEEIAEEEASEEEAPEDETSEEEVVEEEITEEVETEAEEAEIEETEAEEAEIEETEAEEAEIEETEAEIEEEAEMEEEEAPEGPVIDEVLKEQNDLTSQEKEVLTKEFLEDEQDTVKKPEKPEIASESNQENNIRNMTSVEEELYETFIPTQQSREQIVRAIDNISLASYTGNLVITGEEGLDTLTLAKNVIREIQAADNNFSGRVAKISGETLNNRDVAHTLDKLKNGALIIEKSSEMNEETVTELNRLLQKENMGIVIIMEDTKRKMNRFLDENEQLTNMFTARIDMEAFSNDALVSFAKQYAREMEFSIDVVGVLALHTKIENRQTSDHIVTIPEVREIMDEAFAHAKRLTLGHFFDILLGKRYDEEDMIILSEKDFV